MWTQFIAAWCVASLFVIVLLARYLMAQQRMVDVSRDDRYWQRYEEQAMDEQERWKGARG